MKKTISELNSKMWYRFLKVIFCVLFSLIILIFNGVIIKLGIKRLDNDKTIINCTQQDKKILSPQKIGVLFSSDEFKDGFNYEKYIYNYNDYNLKQILNSCYNPQNGGDFVDAIKNEYGKIDKNDFVGPVRKKLIEKYGEPVDFSVDVFDIKPIFTYAGFIKYFFIGNLSIFLCFEIIRRMFYYVISGTIKPKK